MLCFRSSRHPHHLYGISRQRLRRSDRRICTSGVHKKLMSDTSYFTRDSRLSIYRKMLDLCLVRWWWAPSFPWRVCFRHSLEWYWRCWLSWVVVHRLWIGGSWWWWWWWSRHSRCTPSPRAVSSSSVHYELLLLRRQWVRAVFGKMSNLVTIVTLASRSQSPLRI